MGLPLTRVNPKTKNYPDTFAPIWPCFSFYRKQAQSSKCIVPASPDNKNIEEKIQSTMILDFQHYIMYIVISLNYTKMHERKQDLPRVMTNVEI